MNAGNPNDIDHETSIHLGAPGAHALSVIRT
jgi:hypothetical protein